MEKKKLDRIIRIVREEMVGGEGPTNHTGKEVANFDPVMGKVMKRKKYIKLPPGSRKRWTPKKDES